MSASSPRPLVRPVLALIASLLAIAAAGCGDRVSAKEALRVTDVITGWFDSGVENGKNKLVPSISFRVTNAAGSPIHSVQLNAVFRIAGDQEELGSMLVKGIGTEGLAPGRTAGPFVMRSALGYTGEQPRMQMLQHTQFKDAQVEVFAKHGSKQWVKLAETNVAAAASSLTH